MKQTSDLAASIQQISVGQPGRSARLIRPGESMHFTIEMYNKFLTLQGDIYKWQHLVTSYTRTMPGPTIGSMTPALYEWTAATLHKGDASSEQTIEWTFARGAQFRAPLVGVENVEAAVPIGLSDLNDSATGLLSFDIDYASLPKTPAVNLLRLLSWDVLTFEMFASEIGAIANFTATGEPMVIDRLSNRWARLPFPEYAETSFFKNGVLTATLLGYGVWLERACAIYAFECDRSELDVHASSAASGLSQRGSSFYSGKLVVDVENGDLVAGDMLETIIAIVSQNGNQIPVQRQRIVQVAAKQATAPAAVVAAGAAREAPPEHSNGRGTAAYQEALQQSRRLEAFFIEHQQDFSVLPESLKTLSEQGFQILTGHTVTDILNIIATLVALLERITEANDEHAAEAFRTLCASLRQGLEGLAIYLELAPDEVMRMQLFEPDRLREISDMMCQVHEEVTRLLLTLEELETLPVLSEGSGS